MRIVCIGDSITAGQYLEPDQAWPALIDGHEMINKGVNGDTSRLMLERFPHDVQALGPDIVVIQCGLNDCNRWESDRGVPRVSLDAYEANLAEMFHRCRVFNAIPFVISITHALDDYDRPYWVRLCMAAGREDVEIITPTIHKGLDLMSDGLHLTAEGQRQYADAVEIALVRLQVPA